jgi:tRNA (cmo5U34)-methyltransferase
VLDLGAGFGPAAAAVLDAYPRATAVLVDRSPPMREAAAAYMAPYAGRYRYVLADFVDGRLPDEVGNGFHVAASSVAPQYVPPEGKRVLFGEIVRRLVPGGCFLNISLIGAPDARLQELYDQAAERERQARNEPPRPAEPGDRRWVPQSLDEHLAMLGEAGFAHVDCFWKRLGIALFGGFRPENG